ncbi:MAG: UDP-3-O-[3-hydroxymyristoyl] N-acetylglucosamine deacetylase [Planctomycetota bacterium]|jgi:UDP-3-O-[3-hydroxymyristoyl] N-acetylglucosamine deacetylase/3-hydroxyacyl-[acyl-carrier-protein] dehydratase|nr:MAG: UDP-3-O-[3-hydroxymyristoyl] N-acetylglucosamine deacetylase [Planctomycetota bacterium]RLS92480.1 MAG: UDP-3-O-[3-hydroxymyristoyl] N-acetylglucosamine deacetylase [Planctomycetota bacterium]
MSASGGFGSNAASTSNTSLAETGSDALVQIPAARQRTLARPVTIRGKGLMLGVEATVVIQPAPAHSGIAFVRTDLHPPLRIPATVDHVALRPRRTTLKMGDVTIDTVEHCLSAIAGLRIDNATIEINGPELPCGDGSAALFAEPMLEAGIVEQDAPRKVFKIRDPIVIEEPEGMIAAMPFDAEGMRVVYDLDYGTHGHRIRHQTYSYNIADGDYMNDIAPARTFSLREEAEQLQAAGLCQHLTPREMLVIGDDGQPIDNVYRFDNEPVRHKVLDVIGDLSLIGVPIQGRVLAVRSGHGLNRKLAMRVREQMLAADLRRTVVDGRVMDVRAIQKLMPHRYPMLLVDRVVEMDGSRRAIGIKNVTINEPFFQGHYPGTPIMPGVLLIEAMAQLGGLLLSNVLEHTGKIAILLSIDRVKLRKPVVPGDQVVLEAENVRATARTGHLKCRAHVGEKLVAEAELRFMMVDPDIE